MAILQALIKYRIDKSSWSGGLNVMMCTVFKSVIAQSRRASKLQKYSRSSSQFYYTNLVLREH